MYRIKSVQFKDHPILGNIQLDFCGVDGKASDTIIIAGENGAGKSALIGALFEALSFKSQYELSMYVDCDGTDVLIDYKWNELGGKQHMFFTDNEGVNTVQSAEMVKNKYKFKAIYSDVDINFKAQNIQSVTSSELDQNGSNQRSNPNLPNEIKQLIVDVQDSDDADTAESVRKLKAEYGDNVPLVSIEEGARMKRFSQAFNKMFDGLTYSKVKNVSSKKAIVFTKQGKEIDIDDLSSGEKQIVYRGCFLLKDRGALDGAFVFVDEPEISLHPNWQKKILGYYKGIFADENGCQTSQLFVVTHSPFVIHNDKIDDKKVIVLQRLVNGEVCAVDKPEYYICNSTAPIRDAFNISDFEADLTKSVVYLEGRTDEKYFKKTAEVFGYDDLPFEFQWIGHITAKGSEEFSGKDSLKYGAQFMKGRNPSLPQVFLYDCDTKRSTSRAGNVIEMAIPFFENQKKMNKGIENALVLDSIAIDDFYSIKTDTRKDYGEEVTIKEFEKMKLCDYICGMDANAQKNILINLKQIIDRLIEMISE